MPFATQPRAEPATKRDKRILVIALVVILFALAGTAIWAAVRPGAYGSSRDGCITVTLASSTGSALIHECGARAKSACQQAFARDDKVSLLTRPQCRLAGIAP